MAENLNLKITVEAWAEIVIKEWQKKIEALGIGDTKQLINSLFQHVHTNAEGDPSRIEFTFEWYGRMVDYGVGNGVNIADRDQLIASGRTKRKQKPWNTDVFYNEIGVLRHLLAEKTARNLEDMIMVSLGEDKKSVISKIKQKAIKQ